MLEAANARPRFTISLKRSTQTSSAIHKLVGRLPHLLDGPAVLLPRQRRIWQGCS
jgi:hypothetical protein